MLAIDPEPGPAILAVVLSDSLSRSHLDRDLRGRIEAAVVLPLIALAAIGVGMLLHRLPWIGALVFVAGMFVSIWLRRFGPMAARAGALIALPLVVLLTTPYERPRQVGALTAMFLPVIVALLALAWVTAFQFAARWLGLLAPARAMPPKARTADAGSSLRPDATTRMAIQMAVALAVAFVVGYLFFRERWSWIVLTAFIVGSGNRGRLDVAYKSVHRVLGAAAGTLVASVVALHLDSLHTISVALLLASLFLGVWLRPLGYAWWALFVTLALALLQAFTGVAAPAMPWPRLDEIAIGAVIGVASAWFVLPVRSMAVLRRRLADALAALGDALDPAKPERGHDEFVAALARIEKVAPAFRASRRPTRRWLPVQPAGWIDALAACRGAAVRLIDAGETPAAARRAVGAARKAMREPSAILSALQALQGALAGAPDRAEARTSASRTDDPGVLRTG